ncbi:hypothetical protein [Natronococcus wangiae]|uniref:hypothetical protein n=1 Tax=Natronococcus wangiae TaxID=3068275 RepID=UPI00273E09E9|nr:hypothetical protein [Natronococcus sp. AD5]
MSGQIIRRLLLRNAAAVAVGSAAISNDAELTELFEDPVSSALSRSVDIDGDGIDHVQFAAADDPAGERGTVLQASSQGAATRDYAISLRNLAFADLTLADLVDDGLAYDYYVGADNTSMAPNEVCLVLTGPENGLDLVFRTKDDEREGDWYTRDVATELIGDSELPGSEQPWKRIHLTRENATAMDRSNVELLEENLLERFGADTSVRAAGLGHGMPTMEPETIDTYYDAFAVAGTEYELPTTS